MCRAVTPCIFEASTVYSIPPPAGVNSDIPVACEDGEAFSGYS
jgi:hypothetical protein